MKRWRVVWYILVTLVLIVGCKPESSPPEQVTRTVPADAAAGESGFGVEAVGSDARLDRPALVVRFNLPLAQAQAFDAVLRVKDAQGKEVKGSWVLNYDEPRLLRFPSVEAGQRYRVEIDPELLAEDGSRLGVRVEREVDAVQAPAQVGFASQGSVLPARDNDGLPIVAVNVAEVDVEFLRVRSSDYARFLSAYATRGRRGNWELGQLTGMTDSVYAMRYALNSTPNARVVSHLPVHDIAELKRPGIYVALMRRPQDFSGEFETTHFVVTDIGLHVRAYADRTEVRTRSLRSGAALGRVELELLDRYGRRRALTTTDGEGAARFEFAVEVSDTLLARRGDELSILAFNQPALDLSEFPIEGDAAGPVSVYAWSGRDLYRPGERVRLRALLRDFDGKPLPAQTLYVSLIQPDGRPYASNRLEPGPLGYYEWERHLPTDVPTGRWRAEFSTDPEGKGSKHPFSFRVEEFLPERMKLALDSAQPRLAPGEALALEVEAAYLYGAPAAGNRFTAKLWVELDSSPVEGLPGYFFGDGVERPNTDPRDVIDAVLDESGRLREAIDPGLVTVPGPIRVVVLGSVYESGGRPVSRLFKRTIWPAPALIGVRPLFKNDEADYNSRPEFELVRVDASGQRRPLRGAEVKLVREERDYHWSYDPQVGWRTNYTQRFLDVSTQTVDLPGEGAAKIQVAVDWGNYRLQVRDPETNLVTRYPFTAGWSLDEPNRGVEARPDKVKVALDKPRYRAGETIELTITPPHPGPALLLVEADRLLESRSFDARAGSKVKLEVKPEWERHDVYLTVLVFRPGSARDKSTPNRAVGVVHLPIDRSDRQLAVELQAPERMQPQRPLEVAVAVPQLAGQEAYVAVSAVDLGVINITNFAVPDPFLGFFRQRRLAVDAYDLYGRVIEALAGERARLRYGGDAGLLGQGNRPDPRVEIVDLYSAPVRLDAAGRATVKLDVPNFNGALRVSAVVYSADRYGAMAKETIVRAPVVVEASAPRVMAPGDQALLTADVQNFSGRSGEFEVRLTTSAPLSGSGSQRLTLADGQKRTLRFTIRAEGAFGVARPRLEVQGGGVSVVRQFEFAVRPAYPPLRRSRFEVVRAAGPIDLAVDLGAFVPDSVISRVTLSTRAPIPWMNAAKELKEYPYGCIEQTTSKAFPHVLLDPATESAAGLPPTDPAERQRHVAFALDRLASMQLPSGHFSFWPGGEYSNPALTPFVVELLLDAQAAGFELPPNMLQRALERLREDLLSGGGQASDWSWGVVYDHNRTASKAYAGYVLSRVNQAPLGTLRTIYDNERSQMMSPLGYMRLGLALKAAGDAERGEKAIAEAFGERWQRAPTWLGDYGSAVSDHANVLALALSHGALTREREPKLLELGQTIQAQYWLSTQDRTALVRLGRALNARPAPALTGTLVVGGLREEFTTRGTFFRALSLPDLTAGARIETNAAPPLYLAQETVGAPQSAPAAKTDAIRIERRYFNLDGSPWRGERLLEGELLLVQLKLRPREAMRDLLVVDLLPGGLEAENPNLLDVSALQQITVEGESISDILQYAYGIVRTEEYRDDRYVAAVAYSGGGQTLYYLVRAVTPGNYLVPPPFAEDMYRPALHGIGISTPSRITVASPRP